MLAAILISASQNGPYVSGGSKAAGMLMRVPTTEASAYLVHRMCQALGGTAC